MPSAWTTVNIPTEMHEHIVKLVKNPAVKQKYGFASPAEFIRRGLSDFMTKIEQEIEKT